MAEVALNRVSAGDMLGRDVTFPDGRLLLRSGTVLSARHLLFLKNNGIETVFVGAGPEEEETPEPVNPEKCEARLELLERMFADVRTLPHMNDIAEAASRQLQKPRPWEKRI